MDLGITGRDQVEEHRCALRHERRRLGVKMEERAEREVTGGGGQEERKGEAAAREVVDLGEEMDAGEEEGEGLEEVLDLGFGKCRLEVQVPEQGNIKDPKDLVGKNVVTSFVGLAEDFFRTIESKSREKSADGIGEPKEGLPPLRTKIKYVGGSVEAACALGVADGVVDLVGMTALPSTVPYCGRGQN